MEVELVHYKWADKPHCHIEKGDIVRTYKNLTTSSVARVQAWAWKAVTMRKTWRLLPLLTDGAGWLAVLKSDF